MKAPVWVRRDVVLAVQEMLLAEHGGAAGLRDEGMLDSALGRPANLFAYGKPTVTELAASYTFGLVKNHPFIDGNKRIGFATGILFLELNGYSFTASEVDAVLKTLALAASEMTESASAALIKTNSRRAPRA